ncbi:class I SAM-dependent methyltransferase [Sphingopyxis sp.]|uniref:class I SAM-dependent methyltransferase n=1 Tax=Sphingopyxis sp. TaxID=1908224 RepID=UPI003BA9B3DE
MPMLSDIAQRKKIAYFLDPLPRDAAILEIGCGSRWVGDHLRGAGYSGYVGNDLFPPADIVGDIRTWASLGLKPESFDAIIAFEVVEHVDLFQEAFDLLRPGGQLLLTSPVPEMDWAMQLLEAVGLNQKRTSPHDHLIDFRRIPLFAPVSLRRVAGLSQWGILRKPDEPARRLAA